MEASIKKIDYLLSNIAPMGIVPYDFEKTMKELGYPFVLGAPYPTAKESIKFLKAKREEYGRN